MTSATASEPILVSAADRAIATPNGSRRSERRRTRVVLRFLWRCVHHLLAAVGLGYLTFTFCFVSTRVTSESMKPTLLGTSWENGDRVLVERLCYRWRAPRRWEVMAFRRDDGAIIMKRVFGLPGETMQLFYDGRLLINGQPVQRPAALADIKYYPVGNIIRGKPFHCQGGYYVLGDDSMDSDDSRYNGVVRYEQVLGRSWLILGPGSRWGRVNCL